MRTDLSTIHKVINGVLFLSALALIISVVVAVTGKGDPKDFLPLVFAGMGVLGGLLAKTSTATSDAPQDSPLKQTPEGPAFRTSEAAPQTDSRGQEATQPIPNSEEATGHATA